MVTGYPSFGGCVRQQTIDNYVGPPYDVPGNPDVSDASISRKSGNTILEFSVMQHVGKTKKEIKSFYNAEQQSMRIMWAAGDVKAGQPTPVPTPTPSPTPSPTPAGAKYVCKVCAHIFDPEADGAGMAFESLPDSWLCPVCGQPKNVYAPVILDAYESVQGECKEQLMMHMDGHRGVSPLSWFDQHPQCIFDADDANDSVLTMV